MYCIAICEDDTTLRGDLERLCHALLDDLAPEHSISAFATADALSQALSAGETFDLLLLDILMEGKSGMELAHEIRGRDDQVSIVFLTSSAEYLKEGYSVRPLQYLFKPVDQKELADALKTDLYLHHRPKTLTLRSGGMAVALHIDNILYLESRNHSVAFCMTNGEQLFRISLNKAEQLLPAERFCRCHNSYLVNMAHIAQTGRRELILFDGTRLPVSQSCRETINRRFVEFLIHK